MDIIQPREVTEAEWRAQCAAGGDMGDYRHRYVSTDTCMLCAAGPGEVCRALFGGRALPWCHLQLRDE